MSHVGHDECTVCWGKKRVRLQRTGVPVACPACTPSTGGHQAAAGAVLALACKARIGVTLSEPSKN